MLARKAEDRWGFVLKTLGYPGSCGSPRGRISIQVLRSSSGLPGSLGRLGGSRDVVRKEAQADRGHGPGQGPRRGIISQKVKDPG